MTKVVDPDFGQRDDARRGLDEEAPEPIVYAHSIPRRLLDTDAAKVIRRLNRHGHTAYLVGGGVRDLMLGRKPKDFDLATSARPYEVRDLFRNCRVIGRRFRLAHVLFSGGKVIEVATFRRDPSQHFEVIKPKFAKKIPLCAGPEPVRLIPSRHSAVEADDADLLITNDNVFGEPHEDSIRRDFTINGLFYDLERGEVIDFVGGVADLEEHLLRTIGDPNVRFREDPVRILRAIKFSARLDMGLDPAVYDAMVRHRGDLQRAAAPRVLEEILRFLRGGAAQRSVFLAWDVGVLSETLPEVASFLDDDPEGAALTFGRLKAIDALAAEDRLPNDAVLLAALLQGAIDEALEDVNDVPVAYEEFIREFSLRLSLPRRLKDRIRLLTMAQRRLRAGRINSIARREYFPDAATLFALDRMARGEELPSWANDPGEAVYESDARPTRRRRNRRRNRT
ncbi:MAG: polynucleotide adenylyltransferase PcnB [Polyangiales bacterium]